MEKIDVHTHCVTPAFREYCIKNKYAGNGKPDGIPAIPEWSPQKHIEMMQKLNIKKSILSISSPGTNLTPDDIEEARELTRRTNEDIAKICATHPDKFLFFASLPLPDVEGSLVEIDYALDQLGAVGFQILTNSHGIYPGDPRFSRVMDKLSERKAKIFVHPTSCHTRLDLSVNLSNPQPEYPRPILEFIFDSTRALMSLLASGTMKRCPGITVISCHCGSAIPPVIERIAEGSQFLMRGGQGMSAAEIKKILQTRFYFDLAGVPFPDQIHGTLRLVDSSRLLYGSDYPYTPEFKVIDFAQKMDSGLTALFEPGIKENVLSKNALEMFQDSKKM